MEVTAVVEKGDFLQFLLDYRSGRLSKDTAAPSEPKPNPLIGYGFIGLGTMAFFCLLFSQPWTVGFGPVVWLGLGGLTLLCLVVAQLASIYTKQQLRKASESAPAMLGQHRYRLLAEGIEVRSDAWEGRTFWRAVTAVVERPAHVYFMCGALGGFIIPKRAFAAPEQAAEFVALARRHKAEAVAEPAPNKD